jgi:hypothetical protein
MESLIACGSLQQLNRRQLLHGVSLAIGGLSLTAIAEQLALAGESAREVSSTNIKKQARSLIVLWLQGGPSQYETFDPHPGTIAGGETKAIDTSLRGIQLGSHLPRTANQLHRTTLVRSIVGKEGDHERATYQMKTGWTMDPTLVHPSIGAVVCHQTHDNLEIPRHISILSSQWPGRGGYLGGVFDAFRAGDPKNRIANLKNPASGDRMDFRLDSMSQLLEREFAKHRLAKLDEQRTQHETATQKALSMMSSSQVSAFEISKEPAAVRNAFGDTPFGRGCLAAVRLIETGVRCVEVELRGWDSHVNNHELQTKQCDTLDPALASLLDELHQRELLESTVILCVGEFGRTPSINGVGGRDHWQHGFSALLAGGPFRRGYVHGATSDEIETSSKDRTKHLRHPVTIADLHATILHSLGIDFQSEHLTPIQRPLAFSEGQVIGELLG